MKVSAKIEGIDDVKRVFRLMPKAFQRRTLRNANRAAGRVVSKKQQLLAPEGPTGNLVDSIGIETEGESDVVVGPRRRGRFKGHAGHLVEFGTKLRRKKRGQSTGVMPSGPFVEPSFEQSVDRMKKEANLRLARAVNNQIKRAIR